jgi:hypothetical protein
VILHGEVQPVQADGDLAGWLARSSEEKYGYGLRPEDYQVNAVHAFRPSVAFAWNQFPQDVTRFTFEG